MNFEKMHPGLEAYVKELAAGGKTRDEAFRLVNERYGMQWGYHDIHSYTRNHHIRMRRKQTIQPGSVMGIPGFMEWFESVQEGRSAREMSAMITERYGKELLTPDKVRCFRRNHGIKSGRNGQFPKGHVPLNKGVGNGIFTYRPGALERMRATQFKPGQRPGNWLPVNSVTFKGDGYLWIKVSEPNGWEQLHRWVYRKAHGRMPEKTIVTFLDGDRLNFRLDNLALVSYGENVVLTSQKLRLGSGMVGQIGLDIARMKMAVRRKR